MAEDGTDAGSICAEKFPQAKIGSGVLITSVLGQHTIRGDVYVVAPAHAPKGKNLVYFFPGGQIFWCLGSNTLRPSGGRSAGGACDGARQDSEAAVAALRHVCGVGREALHLHPEGEYHLANAEDLPFPGALR